MECRDHNTLPLLLPSVTLVVNRLEDKIIQKSFGALALSWQYFKRIIYVSIWCWIGRYYNQSSLSHTCTTVIVFISRLTSTIRTRTIYRITCFIDTVAVTITVISKCSRFTFYIKQWLSCVYWIWNNIWYAPFRLT